MKRFFLILSMLIALIIVLGIAFLLLQSNSGAKTPTLEAGDLPANGLHISSHLIDEANKVIRVEVIANVAQPAAGFDLTLSYDATVLTPINNSDNAPTTLGNLFEGATAVRNQLTDNNSIRIMYVYFGQEDAANGPGTLAMIDFAVSPTAQMAQILLEDARLSRINEAGIAEYIDMNIGDPRISLLQDNTGNLQIASGIAPVSDFDLLLVIAIGMASFAGLGLLILGFVWLFTQRNRTVRSVRA